MIIGVPTGIRTRVTGVKGRCPRPLDDGDVQCGRNCLGIVPFIVLLTKKSSNK